MASLLVSTLVTTLALEYCYDYGRCQPLAPFFGLTIDDDPAGKEMLEYIY